MLFFLAKSQFQRFPPVIRRNASSCLGPIQETATLKHIPFSEPSSFSRAQICNEGQAKEIRLEGVSSGRKGEARGHRKGHEQ